MKEIKMVINNISKIFSAKTIFLNFNHVFVSGCYAISGPNGSGKSTLLKIIAGAESFDDGSIKINDVCLKENPVNFKKLTGFVPDVATIYPFITGNEFLTLVAAIKKAKVDGVIKKLIAEFCIEQFLNHRFEEMSLGNKKKFILVAGFIGNPQVLILDEPMNELDALAKEVLRDRIINMKGDRIVIFSSHDVNFIENLGALELRLSLETNVQFSQVHLSLKDEKVI